MQVFPATPVDVFIFSHGDAAAAVAAQDCPQLAALGNVFFMPLDEHWETPSQVRLSRALTFFCCRNPATLLNKC